MEREKGRDIKSERIEVIKVPITKGKIPNCSETGSQVEPIRNFKPNSPRESQLPEIRLTRINKIIRKRKIPPALSRRIKDLSFSFIFSMDYFKTLLPLKVMDFIIFSAFALALSESGA